LPVYLKSKEVFVLAKVTSPQVPGLFFKVECGTCCNKSDKSRAVLQATTAKALSPPLVFRFLVGLAGASPVGVAKIRSGPQKCPRSQLGLADLWDLRREVQQRGLKMNARVVLWSGVSSWHKDARPPRSGSSPAADSGPEVSIRFPSAGFARSPTHKWARAESILLRHVPHAQGLRTRASGAKFVSLPAQSFQARLAQPAERKALNLVVVFRAPRWVFLAHLRGWQ